MITGNCEFVTVIVILHVVVNPSDAVAENVTVVTPRGYCPLASNPPVLKSLLDAVMVQLSVAMAKGTLTVAKHSPGSVFTVMSDGHVILGASSSVTVIS